MDPKMQREAISDRERTVSEHYAQGLSHRQVAERLGISSATVRTHLSSVYRKLGVSNKIELASSLRQRDGAAASQHRPSLAVLPFTSLGTEVESGVLAVGLADGVTSALACFRGLLVISHSSALDLSAANMAPRAIARQLEASYVVTGRIAQSGSRIRVAAEVIDVTSGTQVWARSFDQETTDLFKFQDDIARAIAGAVAPEIEAHELERIRGPLVRDASAWELYARAQRLFWSNPGRNFDAAREICRKAIAADPEFAPAEALISRCHFYEAISGRSAEMAETTRLGLDHAQRALELDERDEVAHTVLGYNLAMAGRGAEALAVIERGLTLNPNSSGLYNARATVVAVAMEGDLDRAREDEWMAIRLGPNDPLVWTFYLTLAGIELVDETSGSVEAALEALRVVANHPRRDWAIDFLMAVALLLSDRPDDARYHVREARRIFDRLSADIIQNCLGGFLARSDRIRRTTLDAIALSH